MEIGVDGFLYKTTETEVLLSTGFSYGPETFAPLLSFASTSALGDAPIDDTKAQGAFGDIVGRLDLGTGNKGKTISTVASRSSRRPAMDFTSNPNDGSSNAPWPR